MTKGKHKNMIDIRNILHRLRQGESKRGVQKQLGVHRTIIRDVYRLAVTHHWLDSTKPMPSDEEINKTWESKVKNYTHPLDLYRDDLQQWRKEGYSSVVIHRLLHDKCSVGVQVVRRYLKKHFPKPIEPIMVRPTIPGKEMDIDFGYLGLFLDNDGAVRKAWVFSFRLRHSRRTYREVVLDQKVNTFLMCHVHAFEWMELLKKWCWTTVRPQSFNPLLTTIW